MEDSLKLEEIRQFILPKKHIIPKEVIPRDALFINYTPKSEPYYLERNNDFDFQNSLKINNIWVFGKSGVGKTALINRNLIQRNVEYCFCDLSPITIDDSTDVLNDILVTLEEKFEVDRNPKETNMLKQISQILFEKASPETVIVIDELSVKDDSVLKDIANKFIQLVTHFNNDIRQNGLRFIVSTISNPDTIIENKTKASDHFQYICCDSWNNHLDQLFDVLNDALNLRIDTSKALIIGKSGDSPRVLKCIFKKMIVSGNTDEASIKKAIESSLLEIV